MRRSFIPFLLTLAACASSGTGSTPGQVGNLTCLAAQIELQRCDAGAERNADVCLYAQVVAAACSTAESRSLFASTPGTGYTPNGLTSFFRRIPGGREETGRGSLGPDPWSVNCSGKNGADFAACIRSRFLTQGPEVCAAFLAAFGVDTCGTPGGGWTRGPSTERFGSAIGALRYFCENDPAVIGSAGRSAGFDCNPTALEWTQLGAFGGEGIVSEWIRRTEAPPAPICGNGIKESGETCATCPRDVPGCPVCGNGRHEAGETCQNCPLDLGACPPPPPPSDGKVDCSPLALPRMPTPTLAQWVTVASTGVAGTAVVPCRGATVAPSAPSCIPAAQKAAACACRGLREQRKAACLSLCAWASGLSAC